jgi:hypothetical protein
MEAIFVQGNDADKQVEVFGATFTNITGQALTLRCPPHADVVVNPAPAAPTEVGGRIIRAISRGNPETLYYVHGDDMGFPEEADVTISMRGAEIRMNTPDVPP